MPASRMRCARSGLLLALAMALAATPAFAQPTAHHSGVWTPANYWPGRPNGVQAVHLALLRGDTVFAEPNSFLLAWGPWTSDAHDSTNGGIWGWRPLSDSGASANSNITLRSVARPPFNLFCAGASALPSGDLLVVGGTERAIVGEPRSIVFRRETLEWADIANMANRRWYPNVTALPDGKQLATTGTKYDHVVVFGGRRLGDNALSSDVHPLQMTESGGWDGPVTGSGPNWPEPREYHSLAEQKDGPNFVFGGIGGGNSPLNDVWQIKPSDNNTVESYAWDRIIPAGTQVPEPRSLHAAAVDPPSVETERHHATMYVFGGRDADNLPLGDLWKLSWQPTPAPGRWEWTQITHFTGTPPQARYGHGAVWDEAGNRMILFGGKLADGSVSNQVHLLSFVADTAVWRTPLQAVTSGTTAPTGRAFHAMSWDPQRRGPPAPGTATESNWYRALVFGGEEAQGALDNKVWELFVKANGDSVIWQSRTPAVAGPAPRRHACMAFYDDYPQTIEVFGGELASGTDAKPWYLVLSSAGSWKAQPALSSALRGAKAYHEFRPITCLQPEVYDPATNAWSTSLNGIGLSSRWQPSYHMMFSASDGKLYYPGPPKIDYDNFVLDPTSGAWSRFPETNLNYDSGTGVLYRTNKIMKCGQHYGKGTDPASGQTASLTVDAPTGQQNWVVSAPMKLGRRNHTVTMLPTGEAIVTGGDKYGFDDDADTADAVPRRRPEIWNPDYAANGNVGYWYGDEDAPAKKLTEGPVARSHHSSAILLPDGRVMTAGGHDSHPTLTRNTFDQYSPPTSIGP